GRRMADSFPRAVARGAGRAVRRHARASDRRARLARRASQCVHAPRDGDLHVGSPAAGVALADRGPARARIRVDPRCAGAAEARVKLRACFDLARAGNFPSVASNVVAALVLASTAGATWPPAEPLLWAIVA